MANVCFISIFEEFCVGLRSVASYMRQQGHEVNIIHFKHCVMRDAMLEFEDKGDDYVVAVTPLGEIAANHTFDCSETEVSLAIRKLRELKADFVGISVISYHWNVAVTLTRAIKQKLGLPVLIGGIHPTIAPEECFRDNDVVDFICLNEGEVTMGEFIRIHQSGGDFVNKPVEGLYCRIDGEIIRNRPRPVPQDLDNLGLPFYDREREYYIRDNGIYREAPISSEIYRTHKTVTGRGCPFKCTFCVNSALKERYCDMKGIRRRSPQNVIEELIEARRRNPQIFLIEFFDDIFTWQIEWMREFSQLYKEYINLPFWCEAFPAFLTREMLQILKNMGIDRLRIGVESGSDRINAEIYDRRTNKDMVLRAANLVAEYDIFAAYDFITNNPYETEEDRYETLDLIARLPGRFCLNMPKLVFFPHTTLTRRATEEDMIGKDDREVYSFWNALYMVALNKVADYDTLMQLPKDTSLRKNPRLLWDMAKTAHIARTKKEENEALQAQHEVLEQRLKQTQAELDFLRSRRSVRFSTGLADSVRKFFSAPPF